MAKQMRASKVCCLVDLETISNHPSGRTSIVITPKIKHHESTVSRHVFSRQSVIDMAVSSLRPLAICLII